MSDLSEDGGIYLAGDLSQTSGYRADTVSSIGFVADISSFEFANIASTAPLAGDTSAGTFQELLMIDGYVSDDDLEITMTPGDDVIEMIIGEFRIPRNAVCLWHPVHAGYQRRHLGYGASVVHAQHRKPRQRQPVVPEHVRFNRVLAVQWTA